VGGGGNGGGGAGGGGEGDRGGGAGGGGEGALPSQHKYEPPDRPLPSAMAPFALLYRTSPKLGM